MTRTRLLLADDHRVVLQGLGRTLDRAGYDVVGAETDGRALVQAAATLNPDVIVTDITMPLLSGIEAIRLIRRQNSNVKIVVLSMHPEVVYGVEAMRAGADGYLIKSSDEEELILAIEKVRAGASYVTPSLAEPVLKHLHARNSRSLKSLTARQRQVLKLLAEGKPSKEIAHVLKISPRTVDFHRYRIMELLGVHSVAELARYAAREGLV